MSNIVSILHNLVQISFPATSDDPAVAATLKSAHEAAMIPALRLLQDLEAGIQQTPGARERDLLKANNDLLGRARAAEAENAELKKRTMPSRAMLWDFYAGKALLGITGHIEGAARRDGEDVATADARYSADHADAMLAQRDKRVL